MRVLFDGTGVALEFTRGHNPWRFAMAERRNEATDGSLLMWAEYLVVTGRKAA